MIFLGLLDDFESIALPSEITFEFSVVVQALNARVTKTVESSFFIILVLCG
jgi:hypothetical protein